MESGLRRGQLTKWKDERGFGFIQPIDGSKEVFLHVTELKDITRRPQVGDTIYYHIVTKDGRVSARNAFILGARSKPTSPSSINKAAFNVGSATRFPWLKVLLLSAVPLFGSIHCAWKTSNPIPLILYPLVSLLTFALYADDKSRAKKGKSRIPEKTLHLCELAGGWLGGFIAQRTLRHKNRKQSYQIEFWVIVIIHHIAWLYWLFFGETIARSFWSAT